MGSRVVVFERFGGTTVDADGVHETPGGNELFRRACDRYRRGRDGCDFGGLILIGGSPEMENLYGSIASVSRSTHSVLIEGETGTGKELVARAIHHSSDRRNRPFIVVDCGSITPTLFESELFGHVRGAFTGAVRAKPGLMAMAEGGTVFLDEIGELPVDLQPKLLRVLQEKGIRQLGSTQSVAINARILAATNRDLEASMQMGAFRKDLYFRLNVVKLRIPPLRERKRDIPLLVSHFLEKLSGTDAVERTISDEAMKLMLDYSWPGNVRELEHCLEHASALGSGSRLQAEDLPSNIANSRKEDRVLHSGRGIVPIAELERYAILSAIVETNGCKVTAARLLGIGKTTLYRKLQEYASELNSLEAGGLKSQSGSEKGRKGSNRS